MSEIRPGDSVSRSQSRASLNPTIGPNDHSNGSIIGKEAMETLIYRTVYEPQPQSVWSIALDDVMHEDDEVDDPLGTRFNVKESYLPYLSMTSDNYTSTTPIYRQDNSYIPRAAKIINDVQMNPGLNQRRKLCRAIGMKVWNVPEILPAHNIYLSKQGREWCAHALKNINGICTFVPMYIHNATQEELSPLNKVNYGMLLRAFKDLARQHLQRKVGEQETPHPDTPRFPGYEENPLFTKKSHEIASVLYRDRCERFLAYLYREKRLNEDLKGKSTVETEQYALSLTQSDFSVRDEVVHRSYIPLEERKLPYEQYDGTIAPQTIPIPNRTPPPRTVPIPGFSRTSTPDYEAPADDERDDSDRAKKPQIVVIKGESSGLTPPSRLVTEPQSIPPYTPMRSAVTDLEYSLMTPGISADLSQAKAMSEAEEPAPDCRRRRHASAFDDPLTRTELTRTRTQRFSVGGTLPPINEASPINPNKSTQITSTLGGSTLTSHFGSSQAPGGNYQPPGNATKQPIASNTFTSTQVDVGPSLYGLIKPPPVSSTPQETPSNIGGIFAGTTRKSSTFNISQYGTTPAETPSKPYRFPRQPPKDFPNLSTGLSYIPPGTSTVPAPVQPKGDVENIFSIPEVGRITGHPGLAGKSEFTFKPPEPVTVSMAPEILQPRHYGDDPVMNVTPPTRTNAPNPYDGLGFPDNKAQPTGYANYQPQPIAGGSGGGRGPPFGGNGLPGGNGGGPGGSGGGRGPPPGGPPPNGPPPGGNGGGQGPHQADQEVQADQAVYHLTAHQEDLTDHQEDREGQEALKDLSTITTIIITRDNQDVAVHQDHQDLLDKELATHRNLTSSLISSMIRYLLGMENWINYPSGLSRSTSLLIVAK